MQQMAETDTDARRARRAGPFPNLETKRLIRKACEEIINVTSTGTWTRETADAFALGYVRGALDIMIDAGSSATADFARALLTQVNSRGLDAVRKLLRDVGGN